MSQVRCKFYTGTPGSCRYGKRCLFEHVSAEEIAAEEERKSEEEGGDAEQHSEMCGICFDNIPTSGKRYGLLTACDHVFCYDCARAWRQRGGQTREIAGPLGIVRVQPSELRRSCPTCRRESAVVLPSRDFLRGEAKEQKLKEYMETLAKTPCKNWKPATKSGCDFATKCYFAHLDEEGNDVKEKSKRVPGARPCPAAALLRRYEAEARARALMETLREGLREHTEAAAAQAGGGGGGADAILAQELADRRQALMLAAMQELGLEDLGVEIFGRNEDDADDNSEDSFVM